MPCHDLGPPLVQLCAQVIASQILALGRITGEVKQLLRFVIEVIDVLLRPFQARQTPFLAPATEHQGTIVAQGSQE